MPGAYLHRGAACAGRRTTPLTTPLPRLPGPTKDGSGALSGHVTRRQRLRMEAAAREAARDDTVEVGPGLSLAIAAAERGENRLTAKSQGTRLAQLAAPKKGVAVTSSNTLAAGAVDSASGRWVPHEAVPAHGMPLVEAAPSTGPAFDASAPASPLTRQSSLEDDLARSFRPATAASTLSVRGAGRWRGGSEPPSPHLPDCHPEGGEGCHPPSCGTHSPASRLRWWRGLTSPWGGTVWAPSPSPPTPPPPPSPSPRQGASTGQQGCSWGPTATSAVGHHLQTCPPPLPGCGLGSPPCLPLWRVRATQPLTTTASRP